jgi:hypothetical protein
MTKPEDLVRSTTRAIASTVRDVPPLRLTPTRDDVLPFAPASRPPRRLPRWLAPLAAAAVVLAVAASLVIIRDLPNGRVVPAVSPAPPASVPAYYVALSGPASAGRNDLVVGGTFTGRRLATVSPPKGTVFGVVTAAADDRTFIVDALATSGAVRYATWYRLRISPGAPSPARLSRLPIPATPVRLIGAAAVSQSGSELAVLLQPLQAMFEPPAVTTALRIYSVATGRVLRSWSTRSQHILAGFNPGPTRNDTLSWVDGDRLVAFDTYQYTTSQHGGSILSGSFWTKVRVVDPTAGGSDLISDSRAVTSGCAGLPRPVPPLTADGQTVLCVSVSSAGSEIRPGLSRWTDQDTWSEHSVSTPGTLRTLRTITLHFSAGAPSTMLAVQWADASGSAMIVEWGVGSADATKAHFGVVSGDTLIPLPAVAAGLTEPDFTSDIAW